MVAHPFGSGSPEEDAATCPKIRDSQVFRRASRDGFPFYIAPHLLAYRVLGEGGSAVVFEALHTRLNVRVAVKVMSVGGPGAEDARRRMQREAQLCAGLGNPCIPHVYDFDTLADGTCYLVMERVHGRPLDDLLREGPLATGLACAISCEILEALSVLHSGGIVHRDLKPSNLILERGDSGTLRVRILDLGIAKPMLQGKSAGRARLTQRGALLGTPHYMASEQLLAGEVDARTDLYAVGVILYETLSGRAPFEGKVVGEVIAAALRHEVAPLAELRQDIPEAVQHIVERAMEADATRRYGSAREMLAALRAVQLSAPHIAAVPELAQLLGPVVHMADDHALNPGRLESLVGAVKSYAAFGAASRWVRAILGMAAAALTLAWPGSLRDSGIAPSELSPHPYAESPTSPGP